MPRDFCSEHGNAGSINRDSSPLSRVCSTPDVSSFLRTSPLSSRRSTTRTSSRVGSGDDLNRFVDFGLGPIEKIEIGLHHSKSFG